MSLRATAGDVIMAMNRVQFQPGEVVAGVLEAVRHGGGVRAGAAARTLAERVCLSTLRSHCVQPIPARRGMAVAVPHLPTSNQLAIGHVV
jgi:hypothetical protein